MKRRLIPYLLVVMSLFSLSLATAPSAQAAGSKLTSTNYVAMGDSYTAGDFLPGTQFTYPSLLAGGLSNVTFRATSGQDTQKLLASLPSTPQKSVKYVTLTLGANDTSWTTSLTTCAADPTKCPAELVKLNKQIDKLAPKLPKVIAGIKKAYPNAKIYWAGYVRPFGATSAKQQCSVPNPLTGQTVQVPGAVAIAVDATLLKMNGYILSASLSAKLKGTKITYVPVDARFAGHRYCNSDPWLVLLHPDMRGHVAYQKAFTSVGLPGMKP